MPNAETHLAAVCDLLAEPALAQACPWLLGGPNRAAFLLGAISPDVRAIGGQTREATHFFTIPFADDRPAPEVMCAEWPQLARAADLAPEQAAFVAGYMTHLIMDQSWVEMIVMPGLYIAGTTWGPRHPNWRLYCILMAYLEYLGAARMPAGTAGRMASAEPDGWLPFATDRDLAAWRDRVAEMIAAGGPKVLSGALSRSCGLDPARMEVIVQSEAEMAREAYPVVSRGQMAAFEAETARRSRAQVLAYLDGTSRLFS